MLSQSNELEPRVCPCKDTYKDRHIEAGGCNLNNTPVLVLDIFASVAIIICKGGTYPDKPGRYGNIHESIQM